MRSRKHILTINMASRNQKFFIMDNTNGPDGKPCGMIGTEYYETMKAASIAMFKMDKTKYTNLYDMSETEYKNTIL